MIDFRDLVKRGVHFGHQTSKWCPKMAPYIWGHKNGIHLIDVAKSAQAIERAAKFLEEVAAQEQSILWVGTKKPAQITVETIGKKLNMPYVTYRWIGGTLTNFSQVKKSVTKLLHYEDILAKSENFSYTKKELNVFSKLVGRLQKTVGGIRSLKWPLGAVVLIDVKKEDTALREANIAGIPVISLVDTNSDPSLVDYIIPGNDDSPKAINFVMNYLAEAVERGKQTAETEKKKVIAAAEAKKKAALEAKAMKKEEAPKVAESKKEVKKVAPKVAEKKEASQEDAEKEPAKKAAAKTTEKKEVAKKTSDKKEAQADK
ncbi:30S ribosomal protein S2 [candidate division TM6 bacterium RIFCSPHIGHO2_12_FULL_36_22]|nr:MAG: 30S ribosomal protein S2 [candidate division TM6 bacterium RIFCSPHIGHO2_12_FULL_36_22]